MLLFLHWDLGILGELYEWKRGSGADGPWTSHLVALAGKGTTEV